MSNKLYNFSTDYNKINHGEEDLTPLMLRSKEESAPTYIFNNY